MLASFKLLLTCLCLFCSLSLYTHGFFSASSTDYTAAPPTTSKASSIKSQQNTTQIAFSSNSASTSTDYVPETADRVSNVSEERQTNILQATMMFGDAYLGLNERTLQSHIDHAKRWGYGNHILRREIVGAGQWDKFIFSKILLLQNLIIGELKRPRGERAEWVVWYDADTLILNPNIHWELFLPPDAFPDIHVMATKNIDGFNAGLFFVRVDEWSVEILSDAYSLQRLRPEIDIAGNIEQNALKYLFGLAPNKEHILYQPQHWYNGFKGAERAETEISKGDMLVHFAGVNHDYQGEMKKELMSQWLAMIEQQPDEWQVPLDKTEYPKEIESFWRTYTEAKEMLDTVYVRPVIPSGPDQNVRRAMDELKWAIEETAYDTEHLNKCIADMTQALRTAENPQVAAGSSDHGDSQALGGDLEQTGPAFGRENRFTNTQEHLATGMDGEGNG